MHGAHGWGARKWAVAKTQHYLPQTQPCPAATQTWLFPCHCYPRSHCTTAGCIQLPLGSVSSPVPCPAQGCDHGNSQLWSSLLSHSNNGCELQHCSLCVRKGLGHREPRKREQASSGAPPGRETGMGRVLDLRGGSWK